jgi:NCAIR mutase (PurE)-related protein
MRKAPMESEKNDDLIKIRIDSTRFERAGKPEAILADGKSCEEIIKATKSMLSYYGKALITRVSKELIGAIKREFNKVVVNETGRICAVFTDDEFRRWIKNREGEVVILSAGTSDIPIAEESAFTAEFLGMKVKKFYDVGVAGIHRIEEPVNYIKSSRAIAVIVVAGMEGALPSVIAGLVDRPVIAVPTSVGYGVAFKGLTALFSMLLSCPSGVAVVNIDNGFGAAVFAYTMWRCYKTLNFKL